MRNSNQVLVSIVIPVFNEEENILELHRRITSAAESWNEDYEVVVVNDGSSDGTSARLAEIHHRDSRWKILKFSRNFGHQLAISAGIYYCSGDVVAVMDADLQDPPEELHRFLAKWREGFDVVYAIRTKRKENLLMRVCYRQFYVLMRRLASIDIPLDSGDFCVMDRRVVDVLRSMPERTRFVRGLRSWSGFSQIGIEYERSARNAGQPKYTFASLTRLALNGILSFSNVPLKLASWMGMTLCALSLLVILLVIVWASMDAAILGMRPREVAGWTSLVSLVLLLSGVQLLMLGIIGEYLARLFDEVHARPPWIIAEAHGFGDKNRDGELGWFVRQEKRNHALTEVQQERGTDSTAHTTEDATIC